MLVVVGKIDVGLGHPAIVMADDAAARAGCDGPSPRVAGPLTSGHDGGTGAIRRSSERTSRKSGRAHTRRSTTTSRLVRSLFQLLASTPPATKMMEAKPSPMRATDFPAPSPGR